MADPPHVIMLMPSRSFIRTELLTAEGGGPLLTFVSGGGFVILAPGLDAWWILRHAFRKDSDYELFTTDDQLITDPALADWHATRFYDQERNKR